ncbi:MAG: hypothetical protein IAG13_23365, partial [Deltaproteobacteria bacterium]|nr:hypothetical protein [Nannocystaceae bacterium]
SLVGWAAISTPRTAHGLTTPPKGTEVVLELHDVQGDVVATRNVALTEHGKFWGRIRVPERASLGGWTAVATIGTQKIVAYFELRDVRPPQFEVRAAALADARLRGESAEVVAHASYYFGGAVPVTQARANNLCHQRQVTPPGLGLGYELARVEHGDDVAYSVEASVTPEIAADGSVHAIVPTIGLAPGTDYACTTDVAVQDAGFEEVGGSAPWFVYPSRYLAVRQVQAERDPQRPQWLLRAVDREGKRGEVQAFELNLERVEERRGKDGIVREHLVRVHRCRKDTRSDGEDVRCDPGKLAPGHYRASLATTIDGASMKWRDEVHVHAPPKPTPRQPASERRWLELSVAPNNPAPGDEVTVTVLGPAVDGHGMLARSHVGMRELIPFTMKAGVAELKLRATDAWIPGIELHAFVVAKGATAGGRLQQWTDSASITVGDESRRLTVSLRAAEVTTAGAELPIEVRVQDTRGEPVRGRVALWAVDEALHALVAPRIPDLVREFAVARRLPTRFIETFSQVMQPYTVRDDPYEHGWSSGSGFGNGSGSGFGAGGRGGLGIRAPQARQRFEGTPIFIGDAELDADGRAQLRGTMPDNLTTFRLTAIASADATSGPGLARFGHSD